MEDIVKNVAKGEKRVTIVWNSSSLRELTVRCTIQGKVLQSGYLTGS